MEPTLICLLAGIVLGGGLGIIHEARAAEANLDRLCREVQWHERENREYARLLWRLVCAEQRRSVNDVGQDQPL